MSKGKKKRSIHDLTRDPPTQKDIEYLNTQEFRSLPDRAAGIVLAAILEAILEATILTFLPNGSAEAQEGLFKENGPLGTFFGKIQLAFAMNLVTAVGKADLDTIRRIRNAFAHARTDVRFETEEIAIECAKLQSLLTPKGLFAPRGPRDLYAEACTMIFRALDYQIGQIILRRKNPDHPDLRRKYAFLPGDPMDNPGAR